MHPKKSKKREKWEGWGGPLLMWGDNKRANTQHLICWMGEMSGKLGGSIAVGSKVNIRESRLSECQEQALKATAWANKCLVVSDFNQDNYKYWDGWLMLTATYRWQMNQAETGWSVKKSWRRNFYRLIFCFCARKKDDVGCEVGRPFVSMPSYLVTQTPAQGHTGWAIFIGGHLIVIIVVLLYCIVVLLLYYWWHRHQHRVTAAEPSSLVVTSDHLSTRNHLIVIGDSFQGHCGGQPTWHLAIYHK